MIQFNEDDCFGSASNDAAMGTGLFLGWAQHARVGIFPRRNIGTGPVAFWDPDEEGGFVAGLSDDHWDQPGYLQQIAASMIEEGLHSLGLGHQWIELVQQVCILW